MDYSWMPDCVNCGHKSSEHHMAARSGLGCKIEGCDCTRIDWPEP